MAKQYLKTEKAKIWGQLSLLCTDLNPASKKEQELAENQNTFYLHSIQNYTICHFGAETQSYTSITSPFPHVTLHIFFPSVPPVLSGVGRLEMVTGRQGGCTSLQSCCDQQYLLAHADLGHVLHFMWQGLPSEHPVP